jgi:hypothetical protein
MLAGPIVNAAFPPFSATQPSRWEWLFLPLSGHCSIQLPARRPAPKNPEIS